MSTGTSFPDHAAAELAVGTCLARALLSSTLTIAECSRRASGFWGLRAVIHAGLPDDLKDLALMFFLHGTELYDANGGDERAPAGRPPATTNHDPHSPPEEYCTVRVLTVGQLTRSVGIH
jgi:hypothetical protein